ncbi:MAG: hypothetical protein H0X15_16225 [Acidobacteria bacterium]|nr:hypothetical protein [Acidobacteriota bacterium]
MFQTRRRYSPSGGNVGTGSGRSSNVRQMISMFDSELTNSVTAGSASQQNGQT